MIAVFFVLRCLVFSYFAAFEVLCFAVLCFAFCVCGFVFRYFDTVAVLCFAVLYFAVLCARFST